MATNSRTASTNVADAVANLHLAISSIYAEKTVRFETAIDSELRVACDDNDLEEMFGNLIENAFKWTSSTVKIIVAKDKANIRITIEDDGPGIPIDRMDAVLLPGVREDERISGTGFGLTIASELAELYSGSLTLESNSPQGLRAILVLPAAVPIRSSAI
jgi:signal transduction histidine kinase